MNPHLPRSVPAALLVAGLVLGSATTGAVAGSMVTGAQIKNGSVTGKDVKDGSLKAGDLDAAVGTAGPKGPPGLAGSPGSSAAAVLMGASSLYPGGGQPLSLDGRAEQGETFDTLSPGVPVVVRNFRVELSHIIPGNGRTRRFLLSIDGVTTELCLVGLSQTGCTQTGSVPVPAGSHVSLVEELSATGTTYGLTITAEWGMTVGTS